ncbi:MAG: hypothetical protein ACK5N8_05370 [Alphaproteobacteria bacterium]
MSGKSLKDKIKSIKIAKINKYKALFIASAIGVIPSLFRENKKISFQLPSPITAEIVVIGNDTISAAEFYKNITYNVPCDEWFYRKENKRYPLNILFNYGLLNEVRANKLEKSELTHHHQISSITYKEKIVDVSLTESNPASISYNISELEKNNSYETFLLKRNQPKEKTQVQMQEQETTPSPLLKKPIRVFYNKTQKKEGLGAMAFYMEHNNSITMTRLEADESIPEEERKALQKTFDERYNREDLMYNYDHEYHHYLNAQKGINKYGMSPEQMYLRKCHDELSANLKQFWKQREAYLKSGNDPKKLITKTTFYDDLVKSGKISPVYGGKISEKEMKYIAEGMQKVWIEYSLPFYRKAHVRYVENRIKTNPAYKTPEGTKEYYRILNEIYKYNVNGQELNLYPYIKEFSIPYDDMKEINKMKTDRGFIENDAISYVRDTKDKKSLNEYIALQKVKYAKKERR